MKTKEDWNDIANGRDGDVPPEFLENSCVQIVEQTDEKKMAMYIKLPKKKLIEMLIECNKHLDFNSTALADLDGEETIPFDKAVDRASLNAFDRFEFIKGAKWAQEFLIKEHKPIELKNLKNPE